MNKSLTNNSSTVGNTTFSCIAQKAKELVSGTNSIKFDSANNRVYFKYISQSPTNALSIDMRNRNIKNCEGIEFYDDSQITSMSNGIKTIHGHSQILNDPNVGLNTQFSYEILNTLNSYTEAIQTMKEKVEQIESDNYSQLHIEYLENQRTHVPLTKQLIYTVDYLSPVRNSTQHFDDYIPFEKLTKTVLTINENGVFLNEAYLNSIINQQLKTKLFILGTGEAENIIYDSLFELSDEEVASCLPSGLSILNTLSQFNNDQSIIHINQNVEIARLSYYIENILNLNRGSGIWYGAQWDENSQSIVKVEEYNYDYGFGIFSEEIPPLLAAMEDSAQHKIDATWTTWGMSHIADNSDFMDGIRKFIVECDPEQRDMVIEIYRGASVGDILDYRNFIYFVLRDDSKQKYLMKITANNVWGDAGEGEFIEFVFNKKPFSITAKEDQIRWIIWPKENGDKLEFYWLDDDSMHIYYDDFRPIGYFANNGDNVQLNYDWNKTIDPVKTSVEELSEKVTQIETTIDPVKTSVEELSEKVTQIETTLNNRIDELLSIIKSMEANTAFQDNVLIQLNSLTNSIINIKSELVRIKTRLNELEADVIDYTEFRTEYEDYKLKITNLESRITALETPNTETTE